MERLKVSAPGRICLFGEHQDFLGLPVIAAAINLRIWIEGRARNDSTLSIDMPDIGQHDCIELDSEIIYKHKRDYLRSCVNVLRRKGWSLKHGYDCTVYGTIPINAGVSSSSALVIAWLKFLIEAAGLGNKFSPEDLARLGHQAEVLEFGEPGGMMDHFAAALGGVIYVDCKPPFRAERLPVQLSGFVLADSLQKKETLGVLAGSKTDVIDGIAKLKELHPNFDLHKTPLSEVESLIGLLPESSALKVKANLINRDITVKAIKLLQGEFEPRKLGELLTRHHEQLRDGIRVSTPKIDCMLQEALEAGALGGKINGSGGGGCMFVYAPGHEREAAEALEMAGGKAYMITIDQGARVEKASG
ncbi:MAG: galactokinase family protein [Armatimonadota bacterium]|nr:galactokinase family protein [Armatimonadota bacterium]